MLHSKQWYYSLHRDFQNCYSTRRSLTRFFSSNSSSNSSSNATRAHYTTIQRILHPESNSTHRRQRALRVLLLHSSYSSYSRDIPDIPVIHDLPASPGNSTMFQYLQGIHPIPAFSNQNAYSTYSTISTVRLVSTENSTEYQLGNYRHYKHSFFKEREMLRYRSRCQDDIFPRIELIPSFVLSSDNTNCKNFIPLFHQLFDEPSVYRDYH